MEDWIGDWLGPWFDEALLTEPGDRGLALVVGLDDDHKPVLAKWDGFCTALEAGDKVLGLIVGEEDGKPIIAWSDQTCAPGTAEFEIGKRYFALVVGSDVDGKPILASFCKQCEEEDEFPDATCDDCTFPDEMFITFVEDPQVECKFSSDPIALTRCTLAAALCGINYKTHTFTLVGGDAETGWIYDEVVTTDNAAGIECLQSVYGSSGNWHRVTWHCWSSAHIDYANACCTHDNFPVPGTMMCILTTGGTLFYMLTVFEHSDSTDAEDFDAGIVPEDTQCCEFLWACSETGEHDEFCITDVSDCGLILEGMHPVNFMNGHQRRYNGITGLYGGGCGISSVLPCVVSTGGDGDPEIIRTGFETACNGGGADTGAVDFWYVCEQKYEQGSSGGVPLSPGPANETCEPFYREWAWSDGPGGDLFATVSE